MSWFKRLFKPKDAGFTPYRSSLKDVDMDLAIRWEKVQNKIDNIVPNLEPHSEEEYDQYKDYARNGGTASFQGYREWKYSPKRLLGAEEISSVDPKEED